MIMLVANDYQSIIDIHHKSYMFFMTYPDIIDWFISSGIISTYYNEAGSWGKPG